MSELLDFLIYFGTLSDLTEDGTARRTTLLEAEAAKLSNAFVDCNKTEVQDLEVENNQRFLISGNKLETITSYSATPFSDQVILWRVFSILGAGIIGGSSTVVREQGTVQVDTRTS